MNIYPNPAHGNLYISWSKMDVKADISIYNVIGNDVSKFRISRIADGKMKVNLSELDPGVYFVTVQLENNVYSERVVVQTIDI